MEGPTFDIRKTLPPPFTVAPDRVVTEEDPSDEDLVEAFNESEFSQITDE